MTPGWPSPPPPPPSPSFSQKFNLTLTSHLPGRLRLPSLTPQSLKSTPSSQAHLRPPVNSNEIHHFTHFTFLVVDSECFQPSSSSTESPTISQSPQHLNYTILLCSDAPDFHESETELRLKTVRLPLADELTSINTVEQLVMTPSEVHKSFLQDSDLDFLVVRLLPFPRFIPVEPFSNDEHQLYRPATPAEAFSRKREGMMIAEAVGWIMGRGPPGGPWAVGHILNPGPETSLNLV